MTTIVGNITEVPTVRHTQAGTAVANVTVAVNRKEREQEITDYHDVTLWGSLAENAATLARGTRVIAVGTYKSRKYEDGNGSKRTAWFIDATAFGPELRWATATVTKTRTDQPAQAPAPQPNYVSEDISGDPWATTPIPESDVPF
jgi:single-strand DNA-binding protein